MQTYSCMNNVEASYASTNDVSTSGKGRLLSSSTMPNHPELNHDINDQQSSGASFGIFTSQRMEPLAVPVLEACRVSGFSKSELYLRMKRGEIAAKKAGRTTLVIVASLRAAVESLPPATFRAPKQIAV